MVSRLNIPPSILIYGSAPDLIETRRLVLAYSGFDVDIALNMESVSELLTSRSFDLFILCHSLCPSDCESALKEVHSLRPEMKNLILSTVLSGCTGTGLDAHLTAYAAPEDLIAIAKDLTTHA